MHWLVLHEDFSPFGPFLRYFADGASKSEHKPVGGKRERESGDHHELRIRTCVQSLTVSRVQTCSHTLTPEISSQYLHTNSEQKLQNTCFSTLLMKQGATEQTSTATSVYKYRFTDIESGEIAISWAAVEAS